MADRDTLVEYCNKILEVGAYQDYCPNGLQVEGNPEVTKIVSGVTASEALIDAAIEQGANLLLVHHGYFWKGEDATVTGMKYQRLKKIIHANMNLLAYHLPLDGHPVYGNNAQLADLLGLSRADVSSGVSQLVQYGELEQPMSGELFAQHIEHKLTRAPLHIAGARPSIKKVAWCTGGAQGYFEDVIKQGVDAYVTGEISEKSVHVARESGVHFYAAGHHATERGGVQALGQHLAEEYGLEHLFVDIENPV